MQIHELTQPRLDEGIASALGNIVGGARAAIGSAGQALKGSGDFSAAMKDPVRQQQIKMLADKTYGAWKAYEKDLLRTNPDARETGMYEQALLAFVSKNLLGGQYLPNVINQAQIKALVKQLSDSGNVTEEEKITGATKSGAPTDAERAKLQQRIAAATNAQQAKSGTSSPLDTTGSTAATTPPAARQPPPQQEKNLWLKLIQQVSIAQTQAPGTRAQSSAKSSVATQSNQAAGDARSYQQQFTQSMDSAVVKGLPIFGNTAVKNTGDNNVQSTGNPVADALLLMAGFQGI
jgi:hypothetical protein